MKMYTISLALSLICVAVAAPQGFLMVDFNEEADYALDLNEKEDSPAHPFEYVPLNPRPVPPQFENLGVSFPPPPPAPLHMVEPNNEMQLELGETRFFMNLLDKLRPLFPWLSPTTTTAAPTVAPTGRTG